MVTNPRSVRAIAPLGLTWRGVWAGMVRLSGIALFVVPFGIAFGVAASEAGLPAPMTIVMSVTVFSGAAQFSTLDFLPAPIAMVSATLIVLALNMRHVIMGAALAPWVNDVPWPRRVLALCLLSDANFADSQAAFRAGDRDIGRLLGGGLILWLAWVSGTAIGVAGGAAMDAPDRFGVDVVMICFFASAVTGNVRSDRRMLGPALVAAGLAAVTAPVLPVGMNVLCAAVVGGLVGMRTHDP